MSASVVTDLEVEVKRAKSLIANCEAMPTISIAALWLRSIVRQSEQAIRDHDVVACVRYLRQIREVKG